MKKHTAPLFIGAAFTAGMFIAADMIMDKQFYRGTYPDRRFSYDKRFEDFAGETRETVHFTSGDNILTGYIYGGDIPHPKGLVVFAHGIYAAHESYIGIIMWFKTHGWRVFTYDATGCGNSEGRNAIGLVQSAVDLDSALSFASGYDGLSDLPVYIMGHSWGGFAAAAVLGIRKRDIRAVVSVSGYAYPEEMLMLGAEYVLGKPLALLFTPFAVLTHRARSGRYARLDAVSAINGCDVPVLIVHGEKDDYVDFGKVSIVSKRESIRSHNTAYEILTGDTADHIRLLFSDRANLYRARLDRELERLAGEHGGTLSDSMRENFIRCADRELAGEVNEKLMETAESFFCGH